jgi:hypothetical protein
MATPRAQIVDPSVTPWYHCISRCVRRAFLCGEGFAHRKQWIEDRLKELVELFAIDCAGFAVMDNHLHLLLRLDARHTADWSDQEVARRWLRLFPLRGLDGQALPVSETRVRQLAEDADAVATARARLADLGWFMKCLKEPLARLANKEDGCTGAFWEGRFRSIAILDEESLLAAAAYIDLNPVAAGIAPSPEESPHTSFHARIEECRENGTLETVRDDLSTQTREPAQEAGGWLLPVDDRRDQGSARAGLLPGLTLSCYCRLVDWTSRLLREGKASVPADVAPIFARLHADPLEWGATVTRLFAQPKATGSHFGRAARLAEAARSRGRRWHRNRFAQVACAASLAS